MPLRDNKNNPKIQDVELIVSYSGIWLIDILIILAIINYVF